MRMIRTITATLAMALALTSAGCGDDEEAAPAGAQDGAVEEMTTITVGVLPIADVAPIFLGVEKGFFREENLDVKTQFASGGAALVPAVLGDDFQFGFANAISLLLAQERGLPVEIVTEATQGGTNEKDSGYGLMVPEDSPITSVEDMEGKTFAVNSLKSQAEVTTKATLENHGVDPESAKFIEVPFPEMNAAVERGAADVAWQAEPFVTLGIADGFRKVADWAVETAPRLSLSTYFGAKPYLDANPEVAAAFTRAMNRSLDYAGSHEDEVREIIPAYSEIPPEVAQKITMPHFTSELNVESIRRLADLGRKYGVLDTAEVDDILPTERSGG